VEPAKTNEKSKFFIRRISLFFLSLFILLLQGCGQMPTPDLQNLSLPFTPNYYLICPKDYCNVQPNEYSPVYNLSAEDLFNAWNQLVATQPYMNITGTIPAKAQYEYVQKSLLFGFPDYITVQFIATSDTTSTLAIYSRSRYGFYDFGVNKKRLQNWLAQLNQIVANMPPSNPNAQAAENATNEQENTNVKNLNGLIVPGQTTTDNSNTTGNTSTDNTGTATGGSSGTTTS
jgi:uncharacterized protein (DUF1499 family)